MTTSEVPEQVDDGLLARLWSFQLVRYGVVGAGNTSLHYGLFAALELLVGDVLGYHVVLVISFIVAAMVAHRGHRDLTYRAESDGTLRRFLTVSGGLLLANELLLTLAVERFDVPVLLAQLFLTGVVAISGFLLHGAYTYRTGISITADAIDG